MKRALSFILLTLSLCAQAHTYDRKENQKDITLKSGKVDDYRTYRASTKKNLPVSVDKVLKSVTQFDERCDNGLKEERLFTDKGHHCKYHQEHLIESFVVRDLKPGWTKSPGEVDRFLVGRKIYNRGAYGHYDLVQVIEGQNELGQKNYLIKLTMLKDNEVRAYIEPKLSKESSFRESQAEYILTEISPQQTEMQYSYEARTNHWILNKEVSVAQIFSALSRSINDLVASVQMDAQAQNRGMASER